MKAYLGPEGLTVEAAIIHACHPDSGPVEVVELVAPSDDKPRVFVDPAFSASGRPVAGDMLIRRQGFGITTWSSSDAFAAAFTPIE